MYSRRFVLGSLAMSALAAAAKPARGAEPLRIRVGWVVVPNDMVPILPEAAQVTRHLGKSYVLDLQYFAGTTPIITALASGTIDTSALAFSSLPLAIENAWLDDLRVISDAFQDGVEGYRTNTFRVLKDSPIRRVEDLKGKVLATNTQGSAVDIAMRAMLRKHGLNDRTDVSIVEARFPTMRSLLQEKKVVLVPAVMPFAADPELEKISRPLFTQKDAIGQTQMIIHAAREGFLKRHRAAMTDFLEDMLRVLHFYTDPNHHEQAVQIVAKVTKQPAARFEKWLFTRRDYYRNPNGLPDLKALQANIAVQKELGFLKAAIDIRKYADLSLIETAAKRLASKT